MPTFRLAPSTLAPLTLALCAALTAPVYAENLVSLYQTARDYDAAFQSAKSQFEATMALSEESKSNILPTVNLGISGSNGQANIIDSTPAQGNRNFTNQGATITASQPLYRPVNLALYEQGKKQALLAPAALQIAEQDLMIRTSQAYFDVLGAQDTLTFVQAQKSAVAEQLASAKRNFEVGTATITDTREAQARYDLVIAQEIAADNDLRVKRLALDQLVGKSNVTPNPLASTALPALMPADVNPWIA